LFEQERERATKGLPSGSPNTKFHIREKLLQAATMLINKQEFFKS
jgi:hypothetical protein